MLIDKEVVQEAKEKLSDKNFDLMIDLLHEIAPHGDDHQLFLDHLLIKNIQIGFIHPVILQQTVSFLQEILIAVQGKQIFRGNLGDFLIHHFSSFPRHVIEEIQIVR